MTNKYYQLLLFCFLAALGLQNTFAQPYQTNPDYKRTFVWYFGKHTGLDFKTNPPTVLSDGAIDTWEGCSSISDTAGNLLLYTDGVTVWNRFHKPLKNGTGLLGDISSSQSGLILHHPGNDSIYYIVTTPHMYEHVNGMNYSIVNIKSNNDSGEVIQKNILLHPSSTEMVTATNHSNGRDIWVVGHEFGNNTFYSYLLTASGFQKCPVISKTGMNITDKFDSQGTLTFCADGRWIASFLHFLHQVDLHTFNKDEGTIFINKSLIDISIAGGGAFSLTNRHLYITERTRHTYQYNIKTSSLNIINSGQTGQNRWLTRPQITPHGNILTGYADSAFLNSINFPEKDSISCEYKIQTIGWLQPSGNRLSLPNFNQSYFYTPAIDFIYEKNCSNYTVRFQGRDTFNASIHWWKTEKLFGQPSPMFFSSKSPVITFADTGLYKITYAATNGHRFDTIAKTIRINPRFAPQQILGNDTFFCDGDIFNLHYNFSSFSNCVQWNDNISSETRTITQPGNYIVELTTKDYCYFSDTLYIASYQKPSKPNITQEFNLLRANTQADSFQWFRNGIPIGNNSALLVIEDTGNYVVQAWAHIACPSADTFYVYQTNVQELNYFNQVKIFPNPAHSKLIIQLDKNSPSAHFKLTDISGKFIFASSLSDNPFVLNTNNFSNGIYFLSLTYSSGLTVTHKIIINHP